MNKIDGKIHQWNVNTKECFHTEVRAPSYTDLSPSIGTVEVFFTFSCKPNKFLEHATQNIGAASSKVACVCEIRASLASAAPFYVRQVGERLNGREA